MNSIETTEPPAKDRGPNIVSLIREDIDILAVIFFVALFLRVYFAVIIERALPADLLSEMGEIERGIIGNRLDAIQPPLHALLIRVTYKLLGAYYYRIVFIVQGILSTAMVPLMYLTGRSLFGRGAGILSAAVCAIYPNFIIYNLSLNPNSISMVIVVLLMAAAAVRISNSGRTYLSAALIGVGILFKPLLAYLLPGMLLTIKKRVLFIAVVCVILAPWAIRNSVVQKRFTPVYENKAYKVNVRRLIHRYQKWTPVHKIYFNCAKVLGKSTPASSLEEANARLRNSTYIATYSYVVIMLLGLIGMVRYRRKEQWGVAAPVVVYLVLLVVLTDFKVRYRIYFEPLLILYTAAVVSHMDFRFWKRFKTPRIRGSGES